MSRRSSVRGDVLHVKTAIGLGRFEVGKTRNSYDVPFRPCLGNSWCRAVNSILIAKLYLNVSRITQFTKNQDETILVIQTHFHWVTSLTGVVFPPSCRPSSFRLN